MYILVYLVIPKDAPSNSKLPSVIVNKPMTNPVVAMHKFAIGTYFNIEGICA